MKFIYRPKHSRLICSRYDSCCGQCEQLQQRKSHRDYSCAYTLPDNDIKKAFETRDKKWALLNLHSDLGFQAVIAKIILKNLIIEKGT